MKRWTIFFSILGLAWAANAVAQVEPDPEEQQYRIRNTDFFNRFVTGSATLSYGLAFPMGSQKSYIDKSANSAVGLALEAVFPTRFSVGGRIGYQSLTQRLPRQIYSLSDGSDISAVQTRTLLLVPLLATGSYYFAPVNSTIRPYIQAGAGGAYVNYAKSYGTLADQKTGVRAAVAPAIGAKFLFGKNNVLGAEIQAQYQHVFFKYNELKNPGNLLISAGLTARWW